MLVLRPMEIFIAEFVYEGTVFPPRFVGGSGGHRAGAPAQAGMFRICEAYAHATRPPLRPTFAVIFAVHAPPARHRFPRNHGVARRARERARGRGPRTGPLPARAARRQGATGRG